MSWFSSNFSIYFDRMFRDFERDIKYYCHRYLLVIDGENMCFYKKAFSLYIYIYIYLNVTM